MLDGDNPCRGPGPAPGVAFQDRAWIYRHMSGKRPFLVVCETLLSGDVLCFCGCSGDDCQAAEEQHLESTAAQHHD